MSRKRTILISAIILVAAIVVTVLIFVNEPTAQKSGATKQTAMLVETTEVQRGNFNPHIEVTGTVRAARQLTLSPQVGGVVVKRGEAFVPGGFVQKGELLLQIQTNDYRNTLALRQSELEQARADLDLEQGRQDVAQQEFDLVNETLPEMNKDLVLRQPQLNTVKARVQAAEAAVDQARLNLQRTSITAPFDAHILSRNANLGSQLAPGDNLGRLVGIEEYWVVATVPLSSLRWLSFPDSAGQTGSRVILRDRKAWEEGDFREGRLFRKIGALESQTRLARVIVKVEDPMGYHYDSLPALMINSFVEAELEGENIKNVIRLNRDYLREDETVWVMKEGKLEIREVQVEFMDKKYAYIRGGLQDGEKVVTTNIATISEGVALRTAQDSTENETAQKQGVE